MCEENNDDCDVQKLLYDLASIANNTWTNELGVSWVSHNAVKNFIARWQDKHDREWGFNEL